MATIQELEARAVEIAGRLKGVDTTTFTAKEGPTIEGWRVCGIRAGKGYDYSVIILATDGSLYLRSGTTRRGDKELERNVIEALPFDEIVEGAGTQSPDNLIARLDRLLIENDSAE